MVSPRPYRRFPQPRPEFDHAKLWSETYSADAVKEIKESMQRKNCAVSYIQLVVDQHGFLIIVCVKHTIELGDAKRAARVLFRCIPFGATPRTAEEGLRPMDEVDADRIRAWQTVASLRPRGQKRAREESDESQTDEEEVHFVKRGPASKDEQLVEETDAPKSAAQLLAELSDGSSSEEEAPPRLMLTNGPTGAEGQAPEDFSDPTTVWGAQGQERGRDRSGGSWRAPRTAPVSPLPPRVAQTAVAEEQSPGRVRETRHGAGGARGDAAGQQRLHAGAGRARTQERVHQTLRHHSSGFGP